MRSDSNTLLKLTMFIAHLQVGTQYRSGIYYLDEEQKNVVEASVKAANERFGSSVVIEVKSGEDVPFYLAEEYHQR